jgi:capsid protein
VNFSSARMARIEHYDNVYDWRWQLLVPQFCDPVWAWAMEAAAIMGLEEAPRAQWTAPPMPMIEPDKEGLAYQRNIRIGAITWPEMVRERGYDPDSVLAEIAAYNAKFDALEIVLDCDPRKITAQGQQQAGNAAMNQEGGAA